MFERVADSFDGVAAGVGERWEKVSEASCGVFTRRRDTPKRTGV
jgi:hypothetical protein